MMKTWCEVSNDVIVEILSWVPVNSLMRFRWACKYWFDLITRDPAFVKMHLLHSTSDHDHDQIIHKTLVLSSRDHVLYSSKYMDMFDTSSSSSSSSSPLKPPPAFMVCINHHVEILGSCNGLIYLRSNGLIYLRTLSEIAHEYFLWNPSTTEFKKLPPNDKPYHKYNYIKYLSAVHGFGYDHIIDDYKAMHIEHVLINDDDNVSSVASKISIYTLGSNSWNIKFEKTNPVLKADMCILERTGLKTSGTKSGVLGNGALHWMMLSHGKLAAILCFDVAKEEHREIQLPALINSGMWDTSVLEVLNGCLCIFLEDFHFLKAKLWMMKDYGVKESWTKIFTINLESLLIEVSQPLSWSLHDLNLKPLQYYKDSGILMLYNKEQIAAYDTKNNEVRYVHKFEGDPFEYAKFSVVTYVETLVSLNSGMILTPVESRTTIVQTQEAGSGTKKRTNEEMTKKKKKIQKSD